MCKLEWRYNEKSIEIVSGVPFDLREQSQGNLYTDLLQLDSALTSGLKSLIFKHQEEDLYRYKFETNDGRPWKQRIRIPLQAGQPVLMSFNVDDMFEFDEFVPQRDVRTQIINLTRTKQITKLKVKFND